MLLILLSMKDRTIFTYDITRCFSHFTFYELFAYIKLYSLFKHIAIKFKIKVKDGLISSYFSHFAVCLTKVCTQLSGGVLLEMPETGE